ncbi:hypothetical protein [Alteromonas flava]|uniref:hypothetical protein n=1 Tax=Alteromonas flava TaxID=2048003 RepID=UPI000C288E55|nr:hypothetical protein [Alteromonas flava]
MSVVNQMLKDLEQRNADEQSQSAVYQAPEKKGANGKLLILIAALLCVVILLMAAMWLGKTSDTPATVVDASETIEPRNVQNNAADSVSGVSKAVMEQPTALAAKEQSLTLQEESATANTQAQNAAMRTENQPERELQTANATVSPVPTTRASAASTTEQTLRLPQEEDDIAAAEALVDKSSSTSQMLDAAQSAPVFKKSSNSQSSDLSLRDRALAAVRAGQDEQAITLLQQLIAVEPENIAARKKLAAIHYARNELVNAQVVLERGIQGFPEDAGMRLMLARLLEQQQQIELAFSVVNPEQPLNELSTEFLGYRAALADQLQNVTTAYNDYQLLTQREPTQARWWLGLAIASERQGGVEQALVAYRQALALRQLGPDVVRFVQQRMAILVEPS